MRKSLMIAAALALPLVATPALAQEPELANKEWYNVVFIDFHEGKTEEAMKLIESFMKVDEALGREGPIAMHMNTGEWDMMVAFKMEDGIGEMGWKSNPRNEAWNAELARQLGGEDKAVEHWGKYLALVKESRTEIAHVDLDWGA
ncbi:MAG: hypothetical protein AAGE86_11960 [Pseudomonadota bacterium]